MLRVAALISTFAASAAVVAWLVFVERPWNWVVWQASPFQASLVSDSGETELLPTFVRDEFIFIWREDDSPVVVHQLTHALRDSVYWSSKNRMFRIFGVLVQRRPDLTLVPPGKGDWKPGVTIEQSNLSFVASDGMEISVPVPDQFISRLKESTDVRVQE